MLVGSLDPDRGWTLQTGPPASSGPPDFELGTAFALVAGMSMHDALARKDEAPIARHPDLHGIACGADSTLHVVDTTGAVLRVTGDQVDLLATIEGGVLGALALGPDGTLFVSRVGQGVCAVFAIPAGDGAVALRKLSPQFWRLGLTFDADERVLYTTQFLVSKFGAHEGSIVAIDLRTGEPSTLIDGFHKPVGIAKLGRTLVVADARMRAVFRIELGRTRYQIVSTTDRPESLCACDSNSVLLTSYDEASRVGTLTRIWLDGRATVIASGAWEPKGIAIDRGRAYVATHRGTGILGFPL